VVAALSQQYPACVISRMGFRASLQKEQRPDSLDGFLPIHNMFPMNAIENPPRHAELAQSNTAHQKLRPLASVLMMLAAVFLRYPLAIKPPNFTMVGGMSLFVGARYPLWQALGIPLLVMMVSDIWLAVVFDFKPFNPFVYGSFAVYVALGRLLRDAKNPLSIGAMSVIGSMQFFLITNFGSWYMGIGKPNALYEPTFSGLLQSYVAGLPFIAFTLAGDLGFAAVLFGAHAYARAFLTARAKATAEAG
jgi:hypothetical protein